MGWDTDVAQPTVVFDACVLYPAPVRDLLIGLATTGLFRARWTEHIHEEWVRNLLANRTDLTYSQLQRTKTLMNKAVPDCLVEGYESLIDSLELPDRGDRHVLAAAIRSRADLIVTFNERDFPPGILQEFGVSTEHPDDFVMGLLDTDRDLVVAVARAQRSRLKNPPKSVLEFLDTLRNQRLDKTALVLQGVIDRL